MASKWLHLPWSGDVFGNSAIELAGRVVHPEYQSQGIATELLKRLVEEEKPTYLTTYTRNPAILHMMARVSETLYPTSQDDTLQTIARTVPHATEVDGISYHFNRYDESGLFLGTDPADRPFGANNISLKEQFKYLQSIRNALVVVARVRRNI